MRQAETARLQVFQQNTRDQVPADDKKNVNTRKPAAEQPKACMKQDNGYHRQCPQAIYFGTITQNIPLIESGNKPSPKDYRPAALSARNFLCDKLLQLLLPAYLFAESGQVLANS